MAGQPLDERPRFNAAVTGEFDASPMRYVDDNAPRNPATLLPFSSSRDLGRVDTSRNLFPGSPPAHRPPSEGQLSRQLTPPASPPGTMHAVAEGIDPKLLDDDALFGMME